jgi:hypothetical protein
MSSQQEVRVKENEVKVDLGEGLQGFLAKADECLQELLASKNPLVAALLQYDTYWRNVLWRHLAAPQPVAMMLFLNSYQLLLAGIRMALSGHPAALFPLMRTALESASYGHLLERQPMLLEVWSNRHRGEADKRLCRNTFTFEKAIAGVKDNSPDIHRLAKEVYEGAIDYGAHPNVRGVFGHVTLDEARPDGMVAVTHTSLYSANHHETLRGLCACLDYGFVIISVIALSGPTTNATLGAELQALHDSKEAAISAS